MDLPMRKRREDKKLKIAMFIDQMNTRADIMGVDVSKFTKVITP